MKTREKVKKNIEEGTHYYAGQKKGYWWKYLLAFLIIAIYLIPLYVLFMQSFKSMSDGSTALGFPEVWRIDNYTSVIKDGTIGDYCSLYHRDRGSSGMHGSLSTFQK